MSCVLPIPSTAPSRADASTKAEENKAAGRSNTGAGAEPTRSPTQAAQDAAYRAIRAMHRFDCFAPERSGNSAKWYVDGHDFMWAISELIDGAKQQICILDWWLSPEVYLRRPPEQYQDWRLDRLLLRKATQGVKVHIIVYNEITLANSLNSAHTATYLESLHPNIAVMRHPDHGNLFSPEDVYYWSHHEKIVLVDNKYVSLGGLDLCFGRWDTHNHPLSDAHPSQFNRTLFPGQDYNNSRVMDFQNVDQFVLNDVSNIQIGRMPWHDVSLIITGPSVLDTAQHFVERWNYIKTEKYPSDPRYDWLPLPHVISSLLNFHGLGLNVQRFIQKHPMFKLWDMKGRAYLDRFLGFITRHSREGSRQPSTNSTLEPTCSIQVCRSVSLWSHDVPTEQSIQNAYISLIHDAKHFIYIENQFFISSTSPGGSVVNQIAAAITERIIRAAKAGEKFKVIVTLPEVPQSPGTIKDSDTIQIILAAQWRTINRAGASIMELVKSAGYDPSNYITFYHLRSYDRINGPASFLQKVTSQTGISYEQTQGALARIWLGVQDLKVTGDVNKDTEGQIPSPLQTANASTGGAKTASTDTGDSTIPGGNRGDGSKVDLPIPPSTSSATEILDKFQSASTATDKAISDSVAGHALKSNSPLGDEKWGGTDAERKDAYITELTYIHSKLMIVDDMRVVIGSANLNDRSMKGDGDSEIAVVVEDTDLIESKMDGQPYQAARFAATLRRALFKEHLGLIPPQPCDPLPANDISKVTSFMTLVPKAAEDTTQSPEDALVEDPLSDQFQTLWNETAKKNTEVFLNIFKIVPNNIVKSWSDYTAYVSSVLEGHVASDLSAEQITDQLSQVKGHLVQGAIEFLTQEDSLVTGIFWSTWNFLLPIWV